MLRAIISDIHSNVEALDAVLADVARRKVESIVCLGDVIGYGPQPRDTLLRSKEWEVTLLGNHEEACMFHPEDFNERARIALEWTRDQLNSKAASPDDNFKLWSLIGAMPTQHKIDNALLVHGSPRDPVREYMLPRDAQDAVKMREVFERMPVDFCFVGHSHVPGVYTEAPSFLSPIRFPDGFRRSQGKALVNVGSVGQPRDGDPRASYVIFDGKSVAFHRVEYDVRTTMDKIYATPGLPNYLADRLIVGR
jgi:diadenosine tetraphosphatase ApaH/serine/threonine PP2A family protein phosphatase